MEINNDQLEFEHYFLTLAAAAAAAAASDHQTTNNEITATSQNPFNSISHDENEIMSGITSLNGSCWDGEVPRSSSRSSDYMMQPSDDKGCLNTMEREDLEFTIAFRTKSDIEIMDDGYRWRKYGKKKIKDSPYPRNYYRCSVEDCEVKKKVEREREAPRFVITTYEGKHNHECPSPAPAATFDTMNAFNIPASQPHIPQFLHQP